MSPPMFLPADFKLSIERARCRCNDIAAQHAKLFACFNQFVNFLKDGLAIKSV